MNEIEQLYDNNITLIDRIEKVLVSFYEQNFDKALRDNAIILDQLNKIIDLINTVAEAERLNQLLGYLNNAIQAQSSKDYVLLADIYELQVLKFFTDLQEDIIHSGEIIISDRYYLNNITYLKQCNPKLVNILDTVCNPKELHEKGYEIEFSAGGQPTLAMNDRQGKYYLHSNSQISRVAYTLAKSWYKEEVNEYVIYGLGLGYHIKELAGIDSSCMVQVYEADLNVIKLAAAYTDLSYLNQNPAIKIIYDPDFTNLFRKLQDMNDTASFIIHHPSLRNVKDTALREKLESYFIQYSSIENQRKMLNANFRENILHYEGLVDDLKDRFQGKDLYIVAAGPSLDKNFLQLKNIDRQKGIILATGTVFRKLIIAGISPDYVIVTDANERVYRQMAGFEKDSMVPMLYLSTAYKGFAQRYQSRKYIILQQGYDKSEAFAAEKNAMLFQTGGSVSTTALDIGISFGCKRIIFLGLDLAFTDNYVHASGTSRRNLASTEDLRQVTDINGNLIYTSKSLDIYRQWIENRIRNVKGIEFIDATEGGAKIEGMKIMKLSECFTQ